MSNENNKMQVDIENLFKQNVNDLSAIKELYRKLKEVEEKILQIKYIDSTLAYKLKKDYEKLKKIILDENVQAKLAVEIEAINENLNEIEAINEELNNDIETINSQLDTNKNEIINLDNTVEKIKNNNIKFKENFLLKRNPYGTFENAASFSVVTNGENKVQVLGISPEADHVLAEYNNRDMVGIFNSITTNNDNIMVYDNCSYTINSVKLSLDANMENLKEGMIIDTLHDTKYSAIIKSIDFNNKIIYVYNWYKMGNTSKEQIPPSGKGCKINNITKIWNLNTNLVLRKEDFNTAACGYEMDIINHQAHTDNIDGIDMVLAGTYGAHRGYIARGKNNLKWLYGFYGDNCDTGYYIDNNNIGFRALNSKLFGFLSNNSEIGFCSKGEKSKPALQCEQNSKIFTITNEGKMSSLGLKYVHAQANQTTNIDVYNTPFVLMSGNIKLNAPSECVCKMLFVHNISNEQHSITANMKKGNSDMTGLQVPSGKTVVLYCDGSIFYVLDFNLS